MKKILFSSSILLAGLASAAAPIDSWYSNVFGGFTDLSSNINSNMHGLLWQHNTYHFGYDVGGRIGYKSNPLRYEAEFTYLKSEVDDIAINGFQQVPSQGYSDAALLMANIYYDFPDMVPAIAPYLGIGIGYGYLNSAFAGVDISGTNHAVSINDSVFTYQGTVGFTYNFAENYAVNIDYRYVGTSGAKNLGTTFQAHLAEVGGTYRFDGIAYK